MMCSDLGTVFSVNSVLKSCVKIFMNSEHSGILYCLTWAHELLLVRFGIPCIDPHD